MFLRREDDKLILGGVPANYGGLGSVFVGLGLFATGSSFYTSQPGWLLLALPFIVIGCFLFLRHRTVTTIFDLPSRRVFFTVSTSIGRGWHERSYTYSFSFAEIAGVGVIGFVLDGQVLYRPVMRLRDGQNCWLPNEGSGSHRSRMRSYSECTEPLAAICAATGLPKLDLEGNIIGS
jgi:hypothetical protein